MSALDLAALLDTLVEYGRWRVEQAAAQQAQRVEQTDAPQENQDEPR